MRHLSDGLSVQAPPQEEEPAGPMVLLPPPLDAEEEEEEEDLVELPARSFEQEQGAAAAAAEKQMQVTFERNPSAFAQLLEDLNSPSTSFIRSPSSSFARNSRSPDTSFVRSQEDASFARCANMSFTRSPNRKFQPFEEKKQDNPWVLKKISPDAKKRQNQFKWRVASVRAVESENAAMAADSDGTSMKKPKNAIGALMGASGVNAQGMKDHMLIRAMLKRCEERTDDDLDLLQAATSEVKFFSRLEKSQHRELCRVMLYHPLPKDTVIFKQGDYGDAFYIVFRGAVKVYVNKETSGRTTRLGSCVGVLEDGDSFGELAFMGDGKRNATIMTSIPTRLLKVEKGAYQRSLMKLHESDLTVRLKYLRRVFLFTEWEEGDLRRLGYVMTHKKVPRNTTICKQGESSDQLYFITSGTCRVLKHMTLSPTLMQMIGRTNMEIEPMMKQPIPGQDTEVVLEISKLDRFQFFGERALLAGRPREAHQSPDSLASSAVMDGGPLAGAVPAASFTKKGVHTATVVSVTDVELLVLSRSDFINHMLSRTQKQLIAYDARYYIDEAAVRRLIAQQHGWHTYKKAATDDAMSGCIVRDPSEASSDPYRPNGVKHVGRIGGLPPQPEGKLSLRPPGVSPSGLTPRPRSLLASPRNVWGDRSSPSKCKAERNEAKAHTPRSPRLSEPPRSPRALTHRDQSPIFSSWVATPRHNHAPFGAVSKVRVHPEQRNLTAATPCLPKLPKLPFQ
ncbi:hypothetical protein AB1Y20_019339 [Prymnesium parvum]|uniref:Cyclic nucleotide-binding domain-containing protein n=1 Tax=Prymnesium parvum TaxID=97485 RepID=A0AB34JQY0_PRYPA